VVRLTQTAHGGGCACKIPPGELDDVIRDLTGRTRAAGDLLVGLDTGDDGVVVRIHDGLAVVVTADFFTPVVDNPYDWGRIAAASALSDICAVRTCGDGDRGPRPPLAHRHRPRGVAIDIDQAARYRRVEQPPQTHGRGLRARGHRDDNAQPRHARAALAACVTCATDVTGFGLFGHLYKLARASGVAAAIDANKVPYLDEARGSLAAGFLPGGSRRNLDWVRPHLVTHLDEAEVLLLADAQTSGGLLVVGELPCYPIVGELVTAGSLGPDVVIAVR
jgi:selenide,water dikinase